MLDRAIMPRLTPPVSGSRQSTTTPPANRFTSPIPQPAQNGENLLATLVALKNSVESLSGQRGPADTRAVTFRDLMDYGILLPSAVRSSNGSIVIGGGGGGSSDWNDITNKPAIFPPDPEQVDDRVALLLKAGPNITLTYNDNLNTLTIAASGGTGSSSVVISDVAPAGSPGSLWWDSASGQLFIYYTDVDSSAWVIANTGGGDGAQPTDMYIDCGDW
jgi:hypothetical protein